MIFKFFWSGNRDLMARNIVIHDRSKDGFYMVSIALQVNALLVQCIRRYLCSQNSSVSLITFWVFDRIGIDPMGVFSASLAFSPTALPPFYAGVVNA